MPVVVDVSGRMGFGATLSHIVTLQHYFATKNIKAHVIASNSIYTRNSSENMLDIYFDNVKIKEDIPVTQTCFPYKFYQSLFNSNPARGLTVKQAHDVFTEHYRPKAGYRERAATFHAAIGEPVVGVHFRGSDKYAEADRVDWHRLLDTTRNTMAALGLTKIFVATDELAFIAFMQKNLGQQNVFSLDTRYYSSGQTGAHFAHNDPIGLGEEALVTILALSMCSVCIRGSSHLSAWAKIFNPALPIVMMNASRSTSQVFPEEEILREAVDYANRLKLQTSRSESY